MNFLKFADYNLWANNRTRELLTTLTEEEFRRNVLPPFGSIHDLVVHITLADDFNLGNRIDGDNITVEELHLKLTQMTKDTLLNHWRQMDIRLRDLSITQLDLITVFPNFLKPGEIMVDHDDFLTQYLIHTVHHRAQVMSALRLMKKEAIGTDYLFYLSSLS